MELGSYTFSDVSTMVDHNFTKVNPLNLSSIIEMFIGLLIATSWHFSKFFRRYGDSFSKAGAAIGSCIACKWARSKTKTGTQKTGKESQGSDTTVDPESPLEKPHLRVEKPKKLYPGLDITGNDTVGSPTTFETIDEDAEAGNRLDNTWDKTQPAPTTHTYIERGETPESSRPTGQNQILRTTELRQH